MVQSSFADGYKEFFQELLTDCGFPKETGDVPLVFDDPVYGPKEPNFTDFMAPGNDSEDIDFNRKKYFVILGIIILIIFFLALALTGELFITEKRDGLLDR